MHLHTKIQYEGAVLAGTVHNQALGRLTYIRICEISKAQLRAVWLTQEPFMTSATNCFSMLELVDAVWKVFLSVAGVVGF